MYFHLNTILILLLHLLLFWTATIILNLIIVDKCKRRPFNSTNYKLYLSLFVWLLVALPLTAVFLLKTNIIINNVFNNLYIAIIFFILNTLILLIYYKYYLGFIRPLYQKYTNSLSTKITYKFIWTHTLFLILVYLFSYWILIFF